MDVETSRLYWRALLYVLPITALLLLASPAQAQAGGAAGEGEEPTLAQPPRLLTRAPAALPAETVFPAPEVVVVLELDVDESGAVTAAKVLEGPGEPFDAAALAAGRQFTFDPGVLSTGEPVPVTVTYRYRMQAPPPPKPKPVVLRGRLIERGTRKPLTQVRVVAKADGESVAAAETDDEGAFVLEVPAAQFQVLARPEGHELLDAPVEAVPGEEREETFYLEATGSGMAIVVRAEKVKREVTKRSIPKDIIMVTPGAAGDALKVIQSYPGVARAQFGSGDIMLRGSSPGDSRIAVEGLDIPIAYHFGGLRSAFNSRFLESIDFVPGNFGPEFGRATGGVVDMKVRDPASDMFRGEVDINLYDAGVALEGPLGAGWSIGGAFHRSYVDALLPLFIPDDAPVSFETAPQYYDFQLITTYKPNDDHRFRAILFGSVDRIEMLFDEPGGDPTIRDKGGFELMFYNALFQYDSRVTSWLKQKSQVAVGFIRFDGGVGAEFQFDEDNVPISVRTDWTAKPLDWLAVRAGLDLEFTWGRYEITAMQPPKEGDVDVPMAVQDRISVDEEEWWFQPAGYLEFAFEPIKGLQLLPSVRFDYYSDIERFTVDPRFTVRYSPIDGTVLKAGVGLYQAPPEGDESNSAFGYAGLLPERSLQTSFGVEQRIWEGISLEVTGFYKDLDRVIIGNPDVNWDPSAPRYTNDGTGRIYGLEAMFKAKVGDSFNGWIAYTFQRSFRTDGVGTPERRFDFDQPHILTVVGRYDIGWGWSVGTRFRYVSGNPQTPTLGAYYDSSTGTYVPVYGETNTGRMSAFHQLDIRIDKAFTFETWKLMVYLDVQNVYNHGNQEGTSYNYDYTDSGELTGLPILPIFGVRGEW